MVYCWQSVIESRCIAKGWQSWPLDERLSPRRSPFDSIVMAEGADLVAPCYLQLTNGNAANIKMLTMCRNQGSRRHRRTSALPVCGTPIARDPRVDDDSGTKCNRPKIVNNTRVVRTLRPDLGSGEEPQGFKMQHQGESCMPVESSGNSILFRWGPKQNVWSFSEGFRSGRTGYCTLASTEASTTDVVVIEEGCSLLSVRRRRRAVQKVANICQGTVFAFVGTRRPTLREPTWTS